jgi:phenylpropionate dioxygenase-like ring-hydroxylating dioxygenase large terminal subunit
MDDPVLLNDWHPVAASSALAAGAVLGVQLLDREVVIWRDSEHGVHAWEDRCPHRGTRFSIGRIENDHLVCAYHGWRFAPDGQCDHFPALPDIRPPASACARQYRCAERYGMIWASLGEPACDVPAFAEYADDKLRKVLCGPYSVASSGPRIVENFLDMAHFPFVHAGILGEPPANEVVDYVVETIDDGDGVPRPRASNCFFWQPRTNSRISGGARIEYTYRIERPLTAILTKMSPEQGGVREAISLQVQPAAEEGSMVWIVLALNNFEQSEAELRAFQDTIFLQDQPILENQRPLRLPLDPRAEISIKCDRMSMAYRAYLRSLGLRYGVT